MRDQFLTFWLFLLRNVRWLGGGVLLTFFSSVGQTFFISIFAGDFRAEFGLSHGDFGGIYMLATLASAATLVALGRVLDDVSLIKVTVVLIIVLAGAALLMSVVSSVPMLLVALYLLRLFGQGMMSHTAMVAMGRWFVAERGRAVSIVSIGHRLGEGLLPLLLIPLLQFVNWRTSWQVSAAILLLLALPLTYWCLKQPRTPSTTDRKDFETGRQWTRAEVLRDLPFWAVCTGVLAPSFIGTSVFFHQIHLSEIKEWDFSVIASGFAILSISSVVVSLITGPIVDRYSARQLLPFFLIPLAMACVVLSVGSHPVTMAVFMLLLGTAYGASSSVFGAIWPEIYGTRHLGAVRAVVSAAMVFASALGPGLTGWLIDIGVGFEWQLMVMGGYCLLTMAVLLRVSPLLLQKTSLNHVQIPR